MYNEDALWQAYVSQIGSSKKRGIGFLLTFEEWCDIWIKSGHLDERGRGLGKFHMARHGDTGPDAIGNVKIIPGSQNISEANKGKKLPPMSEEHKRHISEAKRGIKRGPMSKETKRKIGNANRGLKRSPEIIQKYSEVKLGTHPNISAKERKRRSKVLIERNKSLEMRQKVSSALKGTIAWKKRSRDKKTGHFL